MCYLRWKVKIPTKQCQILRLPSRERSTILRITSLINLSVNYSFFPSHWINQSRTVNKVSHYCYFALYMGMGWSTIAIPIRLCSRFKLVYKTSYKQKHGTIRFTTNNNASKSSTNPFFQKTCHHTPVIESSTRLYIKTKWIPISFQGIIWISMFDQRAMKILNSYKTIFLNDKFWYYV